MSLYVACGLPVPATQRPQLSAPANPHRNESQPGRNSYSQDRAAAPRSAFFSLGQPNLIQGNGPFGVAAGLGSQVTFAQITGTVNAQITDHTSAGVDLYGNSQAYFLGTNQVLRNGTVTDPRSAGIRVDGNSEAFLRGGQVAQNKGPGILALVNSSVDFTGVNFSGNAEGEITDCDSSSWMVSDLGRPNSALPTMGVACSPPTLSAIGMS